MGDKGTDGRKHDFFIVDNTVLDNYDLDPFSGWLYIWLVRRADRKTGISFPSHQTMADDANMSKSMVKNSLKKLKELGLITIVSRKDNKGNNLTNHYILQNVSGGGAQNNPGVGYGVTTNKTQLEQESIEEDKSSSEDEVTYKKGDRVFFKGRPAIVAKKTPERYTVQYLKDRELKLSSVAAKNLTPRTEEAAIDKYEIQTKAPKPQITKDPRFIAIEEKVIALFFGGVSQGFQDRRISLLLFKDFEDITEVDVQNFATHYRRNDATLQLRHPKKFMGHFTEWHRDIRGKIPAKRKYARTSPLPERKQNV